MNNITWYNMKVIPEYDKIVLVCFENGSAKQILFWAIEWSEIQNLGNEFTGEAFFWAYWDDIKPEGDILWLKER